MNSILDLFATLGGVQVIFKLGYVPGDDELFELTSEQYKAYYDRMEEGEVFPDEKLYMILPKDSQKYSELASEDVFILTESEAMLVNRGAELIELYCKESKKEFTNIEEKLYFVASVMPDVASKGTKYERGKLHISK
jgi:hypothetical protein